MGITNGTRLHKGDRLLFVGDSNTDAEHRTRMQPLGYGYVMMVDAMLEAARPGFGIDIVNRGQDGDTVLDLAQRWRPDVLEADADWTFIMIGTNDVGNRYIDGCDHLAVDDATFASTLQKLVELTRTRTKSRVVLIEPPAFDLPDDASPNRDLAALCRTIADVATATNCERIETHRAMVEAVSDLGAAHWFQNTNHPHTRGHAFLALQVLRHVGWTW